MADGQSNGDQANGEIIRPVGYRPAEESRVRRLPLTPLQTVLLALVLAVGAVLWFLFTARSVRLEFQPSNADASIVSGLRFQLGDVWLLRQGSYRVTASAPGYEPFSGTITVTEARDQTHRFELTKLPGRITFESDPPGATVAIGERTVGVTPTDVVAVPAGPVKATFTRDRYQPLEVEAEVEGMQQAQTIRGKLLPNWADVTVTTTPPGADIFVDDQPTGQQTPAVVQILAGEHEIRLKAPGHKSYRQRILVAAQEQRQLEPVKLVRADSLLTVRSDPPGAGITLNGEFQGEAPVELAIRSGETYHLQAFRSGYAPADRRVKLPSGADQTVDLKLAQLTGKVVVQARPAGAHLFVNGRDMGPANQTLNLPTEPQQVEVRLDGYAGYSTKITPRDGLTQELKVRLLTVEEARLAALTPTVKTAVGQELMLLHPGSFTMGASRREPGRRANETLRKVTLSRLYYLGRNEVTNAQYQRFVGDHDSGSFQDNSLNETRSAGGERELATGRGLLQLAFRSRQPAAVLSHGRRQGGGNQPQRHRVPAAYRSGVGLGVTSDRGAGEGTAVPVGRESAATGPLRQLRRPRVGQSGRPRHLRLQRQLHRGRAGRDVSGQRRGALRHGRQRGGMDQRLL